MTQAALALELGISMQQLGKYERGQNRMPVSRYDKAMAVLGNGADRQAGFRDTQQAPFRAETGVKAQIDQLLDRISSDVARCRELARRL